MLLRTVYMDGLMDVLQAQDLTLFTTNSLLLLGTETVFPSFALNSSRIPSGQAECPR